MSGTRLGEQYEPLTAAEAAHGGIWFVRPLADGAYGLYGSWQDPARGDEPHAVFRDRLTLKTPRPAILAPASRTAATASCRPTRS